MSLELIQELEHTSPGSSYILTLDDIQYQRCKKLKTPYGKECPYFYGDYYRGRHFEECRLLDKSNRQTSWEPKLCLKCPVPDILQANACPNMVLSGHIKSFLGKKSVKVTAYCTKAHRMVKEPKIGCGLCHELPESLKDT